MSDRQKLIELFLARALKFGDFTLASGKKSTYYLDGKQISLHSIGLRLVSLGLLDLLKDVDYSAIGGMTIGADPIVGGSSSQPPNKDAHSMDFWSEKSQKDMEHSVISKGRFSPARRWSSLMTWSPPVEVPFRRSTESSNLVVRLFVWSGLSIEKRGVRKPAGGTGMLMPGGRSIDASPSFRRKSPNRNSKILVFRRLQAEVQR